MPLERSFGLLADFPGMGVSADELAPGLRRFRFQSHNIFYSEIGEAVLIRAVFHTAINPRAALFAID